MKRYLVFYGSFYYPDGGWLDFKGDFDDLKIAHDFVIENTKQLRDLWYHIVDTKLMEVVEEE